MSWILRGHRIGQAVKGAQRLSQIASVFGRHGFADTFHRMSLGKYIPKKFARFKSEAQSDKAAPIRLREAFEELGPSFVKLGQVLSMRPDIVPEAWANELVELQDNVQTVPFEAIQKILDEELKGKTREAFEWVNPTPLASASIAQVHEATLRTGEKVVLKVQRPEIDKIVNQDIVIMTLLAELLEKYIPEARILNPSALVEEFFHTLRYELDFLVEANSMQKISENMASFEEIVIPKAYRHLTTHRLLTMERLEGLRLTDEEGLKQAQIDKKALARIGTRAFLKAVLTDGLFHGDLHSGNLFVLPGNKLGIIDFGIVGRLSERSRAQFANMMLAILSEDFETLAYHYAELGAAPPSIDFDSFQRDLRNAPAPYMGLSISEVNSGKVLIEATKIAAKHKIRIPGEWMIVFKAILTTEGMGRSLDPDFDILSVGQDFVKELIKNQYSIQKIGKDFIFVARDFVDLIQSLPRQFRWMLRKFNRNDFALEVKLNGMDQFLKNQEMHSKRVAEGLLLTAFGIGGSISLHLSQAPTWMGYPLPAIGLFGIAGVLLLKATFRR